MNALIHGDQFALTILFQFVQDELDFATVCPTFFNIFLRCTKKYSRLVMRQAGKFWMAHLQKSPTYKRYLQHVQFSNFLDTTILHMYGQQLQSITLSDPCVTILPTTIVLPHVTNLTFRQLDMNDFIMANSTWPWICAAPQLQHVTFSVMEHLKNKSDTIVHPSASPNYAQLLAKLETMKYVEFGCSSWVIPESLLKVISKLSARYNETLWKSICKVCKKLESLYFFNTHKWENPSIEIIPSTFKRLSLDMFQFSVASHQAAFFNALPVGLEFLSLDYCEMYQFPNLQHITKLQLLYMATCTLNEKSIPIWIKDFPIDVFTVENTSVVPQKASKINVTDGKFNASDIYTSYRTHIVLCGCSFNDGVVPIMHKLITLDLDTCDTSEIPFEKAPKLEQLKLCHFDVPLVLDGITLCKFVHTICLRESNFTAIPEVLAQLPCLQTLDMSNNNITDLDKSIIFQPNVFPSLKKLVLLKNAITNVPLQITLPCLEIIKLSVEKRFIPESIQPYQTEYACSHYLQEMNWISYMDKGKVEYLIQDPIRKLIFVMFKVASTCYYFSIAKFTLVRHFAR